jgi:hypothetical protein
MAIRISTTAMGTGTTGKPGNPGTAAIEADRGVSARRVNFAVWKSRIMLWTALLPLEFTLF